MSKASTKTNSVRRVKISAETRALYEARDKSQDNADPDAPVLPPEMWENAIIGKYYRPKKTSVTIRLDADIVAWLKASGEGYQTRINTYLRQLMLQTYQKG